MIQMLIRHSLKTQSSPYCTHNGPNTRVFGLSAYNRFKICEICLSFCSTFQAFLHFFLLKYKLQNKFENILFVKNVIFLFYHILNDHLLFI